MHKFVECRDTEENAEGNHLQIVFIVCIVLTMILINTTEARNDFKVRLKSGCSIRCDT